jgi:predicted dehydrogenase
MLRVGLIGCGRIAERVHLGALAGTPGVRVTALADADANRLAAAAKRVSGATPFATAEKLLADGDVDAVVIATPPATHAELALAVVESGQHVYIEKPIATRLDDARRVRDAVRSAGVVGATGFNYRFHPLVEATRRQVEAIGPLVAIRTVFTTASRPLPPWKRMRETGGGVLLDLGSHHIDLVTHMIGEPFEEVWADIQDAPDAEGATATVQARLASGVPVQMLFSSCATDEDRFEIVGENGRLCYDRLRSFAPSVDPREHAYGRAAQVRRTVRSFRDGFLRTMAAPGDASFERSFAAFAAACTGVRPAELATVDAGLRCLAVVEAAEASAASRQAIRLDASPS